MVAYYLDEQLRAWQLPPGRLGAANPTELDVQLLAGGTQPLQNLQVKIFAVHPASFVPC